MKASRPTYRLFRTLAIACVLVLLSMVFALGASANEYAKRSGYISQFRQLVSGQTAGEDVNLKLAIKNRGSVKVVCLNRTTDEQIVLKDQTYARATNILITVPGSFVQDNCSYVLSATLTYNDRTIGTGEVGFDLIPPVANVTSLACAASFDPIEGEKLTVSVGLAQTANVYAYVYSSANVRVATLCEGTRYPSGVSTLTWDGCGADGALLTEGDYVIKAHCENEAGASAMQTANVRVDGVRPGTILGNCVGRIQTILLSQQVFEGESAVFKINTETSGYLTVKLRDNTNSSSVTFSKLPMEMGFNDISFRGSSFIGGHSYTLQAIFIKSGATIGKAELHFTASASAPEILRFEAPATLDVSRGERMTIGYELKTYGALTLRLLDKDGGLVLTLIDNITSRSGDMEYEWRGCDASGNQLASGQYTLEMYYTNVAGTSGVLRRPFTYVALQGRAGGGVQGSITAMRLVSDPRQSEGQPMTLSITSTVSGVLRVNLVRTDGSSFKRAYYASIPSGTSEVTLDGAFIDAYEYTLEAALTRGGKRVGNATLSIAPTAIPPVLSNLTCDASFGAVWEDACNITLDMGTNGYLYVDILDADGNVVQSVYSGKKAPSGAKIFDWSGKLASNDYASTGHYTVKAWYVDNYGTMSNILTANTEIVRAVYPEGVYGYAYVGIGTYKEPIYVRSKPYGKGGVVGYAYPVSSTFKILEDLGEYLYVEASRMTNSPIRGYIRADQIERVEITSPYRIDVCISRSGDNAQTMFVYHESELVYTLPVSTGVVAGSTPTGDFLILNKKPSFLSGKLLCYDALRIVGGVYIHRVPSVGGSYASTSALLGKVASHGCVRVPIGYSKLLYEEIPLTTPVSLYYED